MGLYKRKTSDVWWCRFRVAGQEIRRSTGQTGRRQAEKEERRIRGEIERQNPRRRAGLRGDVADLMGLDIEAAVARGTSADRQREIEREWTAIAKTVGAGEHPGVINPDNAQQHLVRRQKDAVAPSTMRREIWAMKRGHDIAFKRGWVPVRYFDSDWPTVRGRSTEINRGRVHDIGIVFQWMAELESEAALAACLALFCGMRDGEIRRLRPSWIEGDRIRIPVVGKNARERVVGMPPGLRDWLASLSRDDSPILTTRNNKTTLRAACGRIKYNERITLRDLRTMHQTFAAQSGADLAAIRDAAGHTDAKTTDRYLRSTEEKSVAVAGAVMNTISGHTDRAHPPEDAEFGAKERIRTAGLLITNQLRDIIKSVNARNYEVLPEVVPLKNAQKQGEVGTPKRAHYEPPAIATEFDVFDLVAEVIQ